MGEITLKEMRLIFRIFSGQDSNGCVRFHRQIIEIKNNTKIWEDDGRLHHTSVNDDFFDNLESQMKQLPVWNITETTREYLTI
jgi:hypothetical protein